LVFHPFWQALPPNKRGRANHALAAKTLEFLVADGAKLLTSLTIEPGHAVDEGMDFNRNVRA
jgi:hypothetical protein